MKIFSKIGCGMLVALSILLSSYPCFAARELREEINIYSYPTYNNFLTSNDWVEHNRIVATRSIELAYPVYFSSFGRSAVAPKVTLKPGFSVPKGEKFQAGSLVFDLNIVVVEPGNTFPDGVGGRHPMNRNDAKNLVNTINQQFINEYGEQIVRYRLKGFIPFEDLNSSMGTSSDNLALYNYITGSHEYDRDDLNDKFDNCTTVIGPPASFCDHEAVNIYIYDNNFLDDGDSGHGQMNAYNPIVLIDHDRFTPYNGSSLVQSRARAVEHELGHTFHLGHMVDGRVTIGTENAGTAPDSNLMNKGRKWKSNTFCFGDWGILRDPSDPDEPDNDADPDIPRTGNRAGGLSYSVLVDQCKCPDPFKEYNCDKSIGSFADQIDRDFRSRSSFADDNDDDVNKPSQMSMIYWYGVKMMENLTQDYLN